MSELVDLTIAEVGRLLQRRTISSVELTDAVLQRIEETEPTIHAYARVLSEEACADAKRADGELARGHWRGPLHGIPVGVKDLCFTKGIPTEAGSRALAGFVPDFDAAVVERLRDAGAVIVGKTVTHELAYGVNVPPTRSPWLADGYPGGSSAGSGAAVAARSAFGAIGTDTGGSIREPAALNGLAGMKATYGRVSRYGVVPLSPTLDHVGPLTRTVEDCALMLGAIAGYDPRDIGSIDIPVPDYTATLSTDVAGMTVGVERDFFFAPAWPEVRDAVNAVIDELAGAGVQIVEVSVPEFRLANPVGLTILFPEASAVAGRLLREKPSDFDPITRVQFEIGELIPGKHYVQAQRARTVLRDAARNVFRAHELDALIAPAVPNFTLPIDKVGVRDENGRDPLAGAIDITIIANLTGQPALDVPCGSSSTGLPIGMQLIGRPFDEATLFRLGRAYERNHDWSRRKPPI